MTLAERSRLATEARQKARDERARELWRLLNEGECKKRAAYRVGVSIRTASRYKHGMAA